MSELQYGMAGVIVWEMEIVSLWDGINVVKEDDGMLDRQKRISISYDLILVHLLMQGIDI